MLPIKILKMCGISAGRLGSPSVASTADGPSPFQANLLGGIYTAVSSFSLTKLHTKAGNTGFAADIRMCVYDVSAGGVGGALLGYGTISGGFSALEEKSVTLGSPITITAGNKYALVAQASAAGGFLATTSAVVQEFLANAYGGTPPASFVGYAPDGTPRATYVWGS